ncbi:hypothetical protein [Pseudoalteromonas sp. McH1-42]|uniref:hypothetical protein n=1 Tax=Pseudoalteromonas sp. McH1-42 TaxID=2917752 RepID=UPI001EF63090|nr:hypothetical protein [Pseudoalteromonas sp. McH1-42]MCG7563472.1 hypothetical protein [Pseudoalteromonas sp. McH1-42]
MAEDRLDKLFGMLCLTLCSVGTMLLFTPETANIYFSIGRYFVYAAFVVGLVSITLIWRRSFKLRGWKNHIMSLIKSVVLVCIFSVAFVILVVSHSGI